MRSATRARPPIVGAFLALALAAGSAPAATLRQDTICNTPPCTREELQRYELKLIKRFQQANRLKSEARERGELETANRLERAARRNFDRRRAVVEVIHSMPD